MDEHKISAACGEDELARRRHEQSQRNTEEIGNQLALADGNNARSVKELERRVRELQKQLKQRDEFVANFTHDLKNQLIASSRILNCLLEGQLVQEQQQALQAKMLESNENALRTLWNVLDAYRKDAGALKLNMELVNVQALATECLGEFSFNMYSKRIAVLVDKTDTVPSIRTDRQLLRRVLLNLMDNAFKFTPRDGRVTLSITADTHEIMIIINDSGPGVPVRESERIFERFWQTEQGQQHGSGVGLGLYVSKQFIELLGGRIQCVTAPGIGSSFTVAIPVHRSHAND